MKISIQIEPFRLPNYVRFPFWGKDDNGLDVGELSDEQALEYWVWMQEKWLEHVRARRNNL